MSSSLRFNNDINISIEETLSEEENSISDCDSDEQCKKIPVLQIWNPNNLETDLKLLAEGEDLHKLLLANKDAPEILTKNRVTAFLLAAWCGKTEILRFLINDRISLETSDNVGRTALHLAAYNGHCDCVWLLLQNGAKINVQDTEQCVTPLHCAASMGHLNCLKLLIKHGADVNVGIELRSPLHYAVQNLQLDCVKELLENGAIPNTPQVLQEAPLHVAASLGCVEAIKMLLNYGAAVNVQRGEEKLTPLHLAAEQGYPECVKLLIETGGALLNAKNHKKQTPLHLAIQSQCTETCEILLKNGANPNTEDIDGRTPLHSATVNRQRSCECVKLLLRYGADPNVQDHFGYTSIHSAALSEFSKCVILLLQNSGDVTIRTRGGISALNFICKKTPDVLPWLISQFDGAIKLKDHHDGVGDDVGDMDFELKLDFRILVPNSQISQETSLLTTFIQVGQKHVLEHPLCEAFLFLKWRIIWYFFFFSLVYQLIFVVLFSCYIQGIYLKYCPSARSLNANSKDSCLAEDIYIHIGYILLLLNFLLLLMELFQILHAWKSYILDWENYLQWTTILSVFCCVNRPIYGMKIKEEIFNWQHHVAAIGVFLAWLELMLIVARFPTFGIYVQMFTTVSVNFFKFMCAYFCLIIAFTLSFGVIFSHYPAFNRLQFAFIKVIMMMSGELEYEDVFFSDIYPIQYPYTAQIAYLIFVILVTIVLSNLMVGLAVNDIQGLQKSANLDRLVRQVKLMAHLENMLFSNLLKFVIPSKILRFLHSRALLLQSERNFSLDIRPNDPRDNQIPKNLIDNAFKVAILKKEKSLCRKQTVNFKKQINDFEQDLLLEQ